MDYKKNPIVSIQKERSMFTLLGFICSFSLAFICLSFTRYNNQNLQSAYQIETDPDLIEIPLIQIKQSPLKNLTEKISSKLFIPLIDPHPMASPNPVLPSPVSGPDPIYDNPDSSAPFETPDSIVDLIIPMDQLQTGPEYPGGEILLQEFLRSNIIYPAAALIYGVEGRVMVFFIIEADGRISHVKVENENLGYDLEKEAIRVVKLLPKFKPGTFKNRPVRVLCSIPIDFTLNP